MLNTSTWNKAEPILGILRARFQLAMTTELLPSSGPHDQEEINKLTSINVGFHEIHSITSNDLPFSYVLIEFLALDVVHIPFRERSVMLSLTYVYNAQNT